MLLECDAEFLVSYLQLTPSFFGTIVPVHGTALWVHDAPLSLQLFLRSGNTPGVPSGVAVPAAFPGVGIGSSLRRVVSAAASPCGTIVALALVLDSEKSGWGRLLSVINAVEAGTWR